MLKHTKGPWTPLRSFEYVDKDGKGEYFEPEESDLASPYVGIGSEEEKVVTAHDLFSFKNEDDAILISHAPDLLSAVEGALHSLEVLKDQSAAEYELRTVLEKIKKFKEK